MPRQLTEEQRQKRNEASRLARRKARANPEIRKALNEASKLAKRLERSTPDGKRKNIEAVLKSQIANITKVDEYRAKYHVSRKQRRPKWLTESMLLDIENHKARAKLLTQESGIKHVVDHVIPLHGELVSGLDVPWNMQVLTHSDNSSKGNVYKMK